MRSHCNLLKGAYLDETAKQPASFKVLGRTGWSGVSFLMRTVGAPCASA